MDQFTAPGGTMVATVSLIVVASLGLAVVYGLMRVINFAHGEFITLGAFFVLALAQAGVPVAAAMALAPLIVAAVGLVLERLIIRRLYGRVIETLLATFGVSLILAQLMVTVFGSSPGAVPLSVGSVRIGDVTVEGYLFILIAVTAALVAGTWLLFTKTLYGLRARVAIHSPDTASTLGINADRLNMATFTLGAGLAGAAGALLAPLVAIEPFMGQKYLAQAFLAVVAGGAAPVSGTVAAGGLLGSVQHLTTVRFNPLLAQAALLMVAIVLIRFLPRGLSALWRSEG